MSDDCEQKALVTLSRRAMGLLIDSLQAAVSVPDDEYNDEIDLIDGDIKISKSIADPDIFWITTQQYPD